MDNRANNFDCIRLLAALAVIYGHAFPLAGAASPSFFGNSIQAFAVKIFFVISGFLICKSWINSSNFTSYLSKRVLRIFPALIVLIIATVTVVGPLLTNLSIKEYFNNHTTLTYLQNIRLFPVYNLVDLFDTNTYRGAVNGSLWSLPVEFAMYIFIAGVAIKGTPSGLTPILWITTLAISAASLFFVHYEQPSPHPVFYGTDLVSALDVIPYFLLGGIFSYYPIERFLSTEVSIFAVGYALLFQSSTPVIQELTLYIVAPYVILSFAVAKTPVLSKVGRWGDFSYGIYLYGFLIQQTINSLTSNSLTPTQNALLTMPIAIICAGASWHFIEKPALKLKTGLNLLLSKEKKHG